MRLWLPLLLTLLVVPPYLVFHGMAWQQREEIRQGTAAGYVLPSQFSRILAFGHKGLVSDYLFLKAMTFVGERFLEEQALVEEDWEYLVALLDTVTDLDPYFRDPYVFGQGFLTWEAGKIEEANRLLRKGLKHRPKDWRFPFYIGFNCFYFLGDYAKGGDYIMAAARIPGSPSYLPVLAGRLSYYGGQSKTGLLFLEELLAETTDPRLRGQLETRLTALQRAVMLEAILDAFIAEYERPPTSLDELVTAGYLDEVPPDPYGGEWIIDSKGRIQSTSRFVQGKNNGP